jgi:hypothetical protein
MLLERGHSAQVLVYIVSSVQVLLDRRFRAQLVLDLEHRLHFVRVYILELLFDIINVR